MISDCVEKMEQYNLPRFRMRSEGMDTPTQLVVPTTIGICQGGAHCDSSVEKVIYFNIQDNIIGFCLQCTLAEGQFQKDLTYANGKKINFRALKKKFKWNGVIKND